MNEEISDPREHIQRLAAGDDRPFLEYDYYDLKRVAEENPDDVFTLFAVVAESNIRVRKKATSKAKKVLDPARERLMELIEFEFPDEPDALPGEGNLGSTVNWPQEGLLSAMGYRVGAKDPGRAARRTILKQVFDGPVVSVWSREYMAEWGQDKSVQRLSKMAWSIASFANNMLKKTGGVPNDAVTSWAEDLEWLRRTYYERHFGFPWPPLDI